MKQKFYTFKNPSSENKKIVCGEQIVEPQQVMIVNYGQRLTKRRSNES